MNFVKRMKEIKNAVKVFFLIGELFKWILSKILYKGVKVRIGEFETPVRLDPRVAFSDMVRDWGKGHNSCFMKWIETCKGRRVVFDVGAHVGFYSIPASFVVDKSGKVIAFEPADINYSLLLKHKKLNGLKNLYVYKCVVGESSKSNVIFYETNLPVGLPRKIPIKGYKKVYKSQISLDDFSVSKDLIPEVMKIDVEGAELEVLKGASYILEKYHPVLFLSIHPNLIRYYNSSVEDLVGFLKKYNYRIYNSSGCIVEKIVHGEYMVVYEG